MYIYICICIYSYWYMYLYIYTHTYMYIYLCVQTEWEQIVRDKASMCVSMLAARTQTLGSQCWCCVISIPPSRRLFRARSLSLSWKSVFRSRMATCNGIIMHDAAAGARARQRHTSPSHMHRTGYRHAASASIYRHALIDMPQHVCTIHTCIHQKNPHTRTHAQTHHTWIHTFGCIMYEHERRML